MTIRELRNRDDITPGISWVNIIIGVVLISESVLQTRAGHKWFTPTLLTGIVSIMLGIFQRRVRAMRLKRRPDPVKCSRKSGTK